MARNEKNKCPGTPVQKRIKKTIQEAQGGQCTNDRFHLLIMALHAKYSRDTDNDTHLKIERVSLSRTGQGPSPLGTILTISHHTTQAL